MSTTLAAESVIFARAQALWPGLRAGERVAVLFFVYLSALAWFYPIGIAQRLTLPAFALLVCGLAMAESARSTALSRVVRDWLSMGLILAGYWSIGWFVTPPMIEEPAKASTPSAPDPNAAR